MLDLNFNQCLTLLIIAFVMGLVIVRCLMAVVNRAFLVVDYAQEKLFGKDSKGGGSFGMKDLLGGIAKSVMPALQAKAQEFMGMKPK